MSPTSLQHSGPSHAALRWVAGAVGAGASVRSVSALPGATSSALYAIEVESGGRVVELVLRQFVNAEWLELEPDLALHEAESLRKAAGAGVPTPELVAFDATGERCGVPSTLMTRLPGSVELSPSDSDGWLRGLAGALVAVHEVEPGEFAWSYNPYYDISRVAPPGWSGVPELWERAIAFVAGPRPESPVRFIHRDFHPNNLLWRGGRVSGLVDWVNACRGPAGFDVAWCRLNLAKLRGVDAADRFLEHYRSLSGGRFEYDPYWDLDAAMELTPGPPDVYEGWLAFGVRGLSERLMIRRADEYLTSLLARL